jgi:hypothetical protein
MATVTVVLSQQDLSDFLNDNRAQMDAYAQELQTRLAKRFDAAVVEISRDALVDKVDIDGEPDESQIVTSIMDRMVNDWFWLPE